MTGGGRALLSGAAPAKRGRKGNAMPPVLIAVLSVHAVAGLFWIGSSLILARPGAKGAEKWFTPQMAAAAIAIFAGGGLWSMYRLSGLGRVEILLMIGGVCAIAASGVQGALVGGSARRLRTGALPETEARSRMVLGNRIAAGLLAVTLITMVLAGNP